MSAEGEVLVLAAACAGAGLITLATVLVPFSGTAPTGLTLALGLLGLALGGVLAVHRGRVHRATVHVILVVACAAVTACVAASTTAAGPAVTACSYFWIALYAAFFFSRGAVIAHLALITAGLGVGLDVSDAPSPVQTWWFISVTLGAVAGTVHRLIERLRWLAHRDPLTGLLTRAAFGSVAGQALRWATRTGRPVSLALIDLDDFKIVNDTHGHARGDALLSSLARAWQGAVRGADVLGRHGGDEFVLLLPATTAGSAHAVLQRMRESMPEVGWSAGVAQWNGEPLEDWMTRADRDLYRHKHRRKSERPNPAGRPADHRPPDRTTAGAGGHRGGIASTTWN